MGRNERWQRNDVACLALTERIPTAPVEHRRRRATQPDRVPIGDAEHGEHDTEQVTNERRIEPDETVATDERQRNHDYDTDNTPREPATIEMVR